MNSSVFVAPADNPSQAQQLAGTRRSDGVRGLSWLPQDRVLYEGSEDPPQTWEMDIDGSNRRQLSRIGGLANDGVASADGNTIFFSFTRNFKNEIWRMNRDGTDAQAAIVEEKSVWNPEISRDGKWIVYYSNASGPKKVPAQGGPAVTLDLFGGYGTISCDSRWIAFQHFDEKNHLDQIEVVAADGSGLPRFLPFTSEDQVPSLSNMGTLPIRWNASGTALTYVRTKDGVSNLWSQPIGGGAAKQITHYTSGMIWRHTWSCDGKYLALAQGSLAIDAVMLTDQR